jgi:O-acetyl-ADP-ribose deacetylase (regulator of RNase III)
MSCLNIIHGNVLNLNRIGFNYLLQVVNDSGKYGAGISGAISRKWPVVEQEYRKLSKLNNNQLLLGEVQFVKVADDLVVCNMVAQHNIVSYNNPIPIKYDALQRCFVKVRSGAIKDKALINMPKIGCGLAQGKWEMIEPIIKNELVAFGIGVTVYEL